MKRTLSNARTISLVKSPSQNTRNSSADNSKIHHRPTFKRSLIAASLAVAFTPMAYAAPSGGQVTSGSGSFNQNGATTTITQSSQNLSLNWNSFNVGSSETVNFLQPSSSAIAVNRILDTNGTQILGNLNANGQVYLINPNGILFGQGAQVNVGGLVASTLNISDASVGNTTQSFIGTGTGSIVNQGTINAADGGYVALLGNTVSNQGTINANLGTVALGAGSAATLTFAGNSLVKMQVDQSTLNNLAENKALIQADGGMVLMSAGAKDALLASVVNNSGIIEARTVENRNGTIILMGGMAAGTANVGGTLDASAANGNGGYIETSAAHVKVANDAKVTTAAANGLSGTWLIDPVDFTIAATGGDMTGATLSTSLGSGNVTIASSSGGSGTAGDVNVNDTVNWSANKLTLNAQNNININSTMNATGTAGLALEYGQANINAGNTSTYNVNAPVNLASTASFSTKLGNDVSATTYTIINTLGAAGSTTGTDLQGMSGGLSGNYVLGSNIDASGTSTWNACTTCNAGGAGNFGFAPVGDSTNKFTGTFDGLGHTVNNLNINRPTTNYVGLFGFTGTGSAINNVGLVGGSVNGNAAVGGLVGSNYGKVSNSYATGSVSGGSFYIGGLIGWNGSAINNSYATGSVIGANTLGGLVGGNTGPINNSYATGSVSGSSYIGGLTGLNGGTINNSYATGAVVNGSSSYIGGLVGRNLGGTVNSSYWDTTTSGQATSAGGTGLTTTQMQTASNFTGFTFTTTPGATGNNWVMVDVDGTLNNAGSAAGATFPMLASEYSTTINNAHQLQLMAMAPSASYTLGANINAAATGTGKDVWGSGGFVPVGTYGTNFTGSFDGLGHTISGLTTNLPTTSNVGLFGYTGSGSIISNVGLLGGSVSGSSYVGGLVGFNYGGTISNSYNTGVTIGVGTIPSPATFIGGLVGYNYGGTVSNSYATGNVSGVSVVGGLVGNNNGGGTVRNSYATGNVTGTGTGSYFGGLVGLNNTSGINSITNSYATGAVSGTTNVGGLAGYNYGGTINNSYAIGAVSGTTSVGGLVGLNTGTVTNSYWNTDIYGSSAAGTGLNTAGMMSMSNFSGWDIASTGGSTAIWRIYEGSTTPLLRSFLTDITLAPVFDGTGQTLTNIGDYTSSIASPNTGNILLSGLTLSSTATPGSYTALLNVSSNQQGYDISTTASTITGSGGAANNLDIVSSSAWSAGTLTLNAQNNININASLNASGSGGVALKYGQGAVASGNTSNYSLSNGAQINLPDGLNFSTQRGSNGTAVNYTVITALGAEGDATVAPATMSLQGINTNVSGNYVLGANIDASGTLSWNSSTGFTSIGSQASRYTGTFDGLGHTISNLTIASASNNVGLFGYTGTSALIQNVGLVGGSIAGNNNVGGLVGVNIGRIVNAYNTGTVGGAISTGGLVGYNFGRITGSHATGNVTGSGRSGGLVGYNIGGIIRTSYATGDVSGTYAVGGLVGNANGGIIGNSYASGVITGTGNNVGGLVGYNTGTINYSYASGNVNGSGVNTGGLVGVNTGSGVIYYDYATSNVSGSNAVGGLVGYNINSGVIGNSYATGNVGGTDYVGGLAGGNNSTIRTSYAVSSLTATGTNVGGLLGSNGGTVNGSYWNTDVYGSSAGGTGLTSAQMKLQASFINWNFASVWSINSGISYPTLGF